LGCAQRWRPLFLQSAPSDAEANDEFNDFDTTDMSMMMEYKHVTSCPTLRASFCLYQTDGLAARPSAVAPDDGTPIKSPDSGDRLGAVSYAFTVCIIR